MATSRQIQHMLRRPSLFMRFRATGQLPQGVRPQSPLIDALNRISPRDRMRMTGMTVDRGLGYNGSRRFHTVEQALHWLAPEPEVFDAFPAESWRIKNFGRYLSFEDVARCCANVPEDILQRYAPLKRA